RVRRALLLVLIGYAMRAPVPVVLGAPAETALQTMWVVDVLQCIGVTLLLLEALTRGLRERRRVGLGCAALAVLAVAAAPWAEGVPISGIWRPLGNYLTARGGSLFPLLPWSGF